MKKSFKLKKGMFEIDENGEVFEKRFIPPLNLCSSPKAIDSALECSSLTFRNKQRSLVHKSLDFNLSSNKILTPKIIKADHSIVAAATPKASTFRKLEFESTVLLNNRKIAKNILLDIFPA